MTFTYWILNSDGNIENFFVSIFIDIVFFIFTRCKNAKSEANIVFMEYVVKVQGDPFKMSHLTKFDE